MKSNKDRAMKESKNTEMPSFVYRDGMTADKEYVEWLSDVKTRFRQCQIKASIRVNTTMLEFYWSIGRDLVALRAEERWGAGVVKQFALDMRQAFPDATGFSHTNVKYMKQWYSFYFEQFAKSHQVDGQLTATGKSHQVGGQLEMPEALGQVPWKHHVYIVSKCQTLEEAFFYINKITTEGWSRSFLEHQLASNLYEIQGSAITNFDTTLPISQSELAKELLKKEYDLSFITAEEVKKEKDLENALANNITEFLLELGRGFSYVGRQMELQMPGGQTFFPDLVFYHIPQHRYVVVELKAVKFIPEFAGKLNFYVTAADKLLRGEGDNPSVGLLICKSTDKTIVEWSLQDIQKPLGVASYQLQEVVERTIAELENLKKHEIE
jgi:predicted nuclease of restriction endonuclease-like (RecB) superfamily